VSTKHKKEKSDSWQVDKKVLSKPYRKFKRWLVKSGPGVALLAFAVVVTIGAAFLVKSGWPFFKRDLTTTVTAATESLSFSLNKGAQSSWVLPRGDFLVDDKLSANSQCDLQTPVNKFVPDQYLCTVDHSTRLVIEGSAEVSLEVTPDGRWDMAVLSNDDSKIVARVLNDKDEELASYEQEIRFSTTLGEQNKKEDTRSKIPVSIRISIIAASGEVGSHIRYATGISGPPGDFWQPTLLSGNVATFGLNHPGRGKHQILSERLDTGDIVEIYTDDGPDSQKSDDTIWGVATIENRTVLLSDTTEVTQYVIYAVLHTTHRTLRVKRFGSPAGHEIKASVWSIISRWPNGQQAWVILISVILLLTFVLQLSDSLERISLNKKKKGKKHSKRKRKGD